MPDLKPGPEMDALVAGALKLKTRLVEVAQFSSSIDSSPPDSVRVWTFRGKDYFGAPPPFSTDPGEAIGALDETCDDGYTIERLGITRIVTIYGRVFEGITAEKIKGISGISLAHAICAAIIEAEGVGK